MLTLLTVFKNKVSCDHLRRRAIVEPRQSTPGKLSKLSEDEKKLRNAIETDLPVFATCEETSLFQETPFTVLFVAIHNVLCAKIVSDLGAATLYDKAS